MNVRYDVLKLPVNKRKSIAKFARKLLKEQPNIHTIILDRKHGVEKAEQLTDFELLLFFNAETDSETKRIISESSFYGGSGKPSENYRVYHPGKAYQKNERRILREEAIGLLYKFSDIQDRKTEYLEFLQEHRKFFTINDYMDISTVNSPEMEKSNPLFYQVFMTSHFEKGYLVYNELVKPYITMHINLSEE